MLPPQAEPSQTEASGNDLAGLARILKSLLPSLTQASLVGSGLIVSYGYPLLFGLSTYGQFATATVLTFITQRIVDLIAESTIAERDPLALIKASLIVSACALMLLAGLRLAFPTMLQTVFDLKLFLSLAASTVILNLMFQIGSKVTQFLYAAAFGTLNLVTTMIWFAWGRDDLPMALTLTNMLGFLIGSALLLVEHRRTAAPAVPAPRTANIVVFGQLPFRLLFASFQIIAAFGAVLIASWHLPAEQVGALRLLTTFALMGYSLSPVNPKMLYAISRTVDGPNDLVHVMRPFAPVFAALLLCWLIAITIVGWTHMADDSHLYLYALALYPVVLFSSVLEKVFLNRRGIRTIGIVVGIFSALVAASLLSGTSVQYYAAILIISVGGYPIFLSATMSPKFIPMSLFVVMLASIGALLIGGFLIVAISMAILTVGFATLLPRLSS